MHDWIRFPLTVLESLGAIAGARLDTRGSFQPTHHIWSRGLALLCDHNGGFDYVRKQRGSGRPPLPFASTDYSAIRDGALVWVRTTSLPAFVERVLPNIDARFALVTGDEDWSIPTDFTGSSAILSNPNVVCWFAQNCDGTDASGKLHPIPIGVDFHTIANRRKWRHLQATPAQQEAELERLRTQMPENGARLVRAHADFHFNLGRGVGQGSRRAVYETLAGNSNVDFQTRKLSRNGLWREKTRYAFVVSPRGNGLDCHRTWESLLLGNIPIVERSPLDLLYDGLPVVIVDDFREITSHALQRWHAEHQGRFADGAVRERLTNRYWIARIQRVLGEKLTEAR